MTPKTLLIIGLRWPEPTATAAGVRMVQLIEVFRETGYQITFGCAASENEFSADLEAMGVQKVLLALNHASFDIFVTDLQPDVVLFDRFLTEEQFGWRVAEFAPKALRILDTEDLHSLRHVRETLFKKNIPFTTEAWLQDDKTKREIASIYRCDLSLIISSYEMELLTQSIKIDKKLLMHLPFMVAKIPDTKSLLTFEERTDFIFIGGGKHTPNVDAIKWLKTKIWPAIRTQLPKAELKIYGAYLPQQVLEMHHPKTGFQVMGRAENSQEVMQSARVCLAPLRFGAGIKGKLIHAMQFGTPSVTTPVGAEGMHANLPWNGSIAKNRTEFVKGAVTLYTNKTIWSKAQLQGLEILKTSYSKTPLQKALYTKIESLQNNLIAHRAQNFIGSLLQHQTLASTKYMGKWIEEKNREE